MGFNSLSTGQMYSWHISDIECVYPFDIYENKPKESNEILTVFSVKDFDIVYIV